MPPAGVSMLRFLATVFLAVAKYTGRTYPAGINMLTFLVADFVLSLNFPSGTIII
jgi:hypothetical protein